MRALTPSAEHLALIGTALRDITGKAEWDTITPLTRGISGASIYEVEVDYHFYVVKISTRIQRGSAALKNEFNNMKKASLSNVSPKVYFADPEAGIMLMEYINSKPTKQLEAGDKLHVQSLANLISRLHQCTEFSSGPSVFQKSQRLVQHLSAAYSNHPLVFQSSELLESLEESLNDPIDLRPSHRDINPYNLYFDLATCVNYFFYDNADIARYFLEQYFGEALSEIQQHKLHLMRIASLIYVGTNFLFLASESAQPLLSNEKCRILPEYADYMKLIDVSKKLSEPLVQQEYGFVCFKKMLSLVEHPDYSAAMEELVGSRPSLGK